jgi:signal transduction histidine kinase
MYCPARVWTFCYNSYSESWWCEWCGDDFTEQWLVDAGYAEEPFDYDAYYAQYELRFALTDSYAARLRVQYAENERVFWRHAGTLIAAGFGILFSLLYLLVICGRQPGSDEKHLSSVWDKPWLDVMFAAIGFLALTVVWIADWIWFRSNSIWDEPRFFVYLGVLTAVFASLGLWWLLCAVKRLKNLTILKHTLTYVILAAIFRPAARLSRAVFNGAPLTVQTGLCVLFIPAMIGFFVLLCVLFQTAFFLIPMVWCVFAVMALFIWKAVYLSDVAKGIDRLAKGDYNTPVSENGSGVLKQMAQNVNAATDGLKAAVERELTGQRFKAELITNVSHDLRTPLTSVITYADLLQSEGMHAPDAEKYLDIIRQKAHRLQTLTEDLFEASKASSGETRAELAPLDINQLIEQTLGEMGDRLAAAGLEARFTSGCGTVIADGKLLCRVFENLLRNVEKYALAGTRVYIETANHPYTGGVSAGSFAAVTIRNISASPLNGKAERLAERFTRGDDARTTEGSGLGLAIVKSFMDLQNGNFAIAADGDLFKVTLTLPLA